MINKLNSIDHLAELNVSQLQKGEISRYWLHMVDDGIGMPISIPVMVARGVNEGPVLGLTAAVHGNELNGISVIQRTFKELDVSKLSGTVLGVPVINVPSLLRERRRFPDGTDLNHIMPGKSDGNLSEVYAWRITHHLLSEIDYLVDLHTASNGRINSYYVRADMENEVVKNMALLQNAQIIVHNPPSDGTFRGAAAEKGIPAITLEVGNPNTFQKGLIRDGLSGIRNVLNYFGMSNIAIDKNGSEETVLCKNSYWMYCDTGGVLNVLPDVTDKVIKGQTIATVSNIFGDRIKEYHAPEDGVVIGKSVNPINQTGGRILHLGICA
jgi:predicted deacylase